MRTAPPPCKECTSGWNRARRWRLLGANGSGKTTFVLHLNGLLTGEGEVRVGGLAVEKANLPAIRRKIGIVFQDSESQLFMPTVLEDVCFGLLNFRDDFRRRRSGGPAPH